MTAEIEIEIRNTKGIVRKFINWKERNFRNKKIQDMLRRGERESSDNRM